MESIWAGIAFFQKGGLVMYVLLITSVFVVVIGTERLLYFRAHDTGRAFAQAFCNRVANADLSGAMKLADEARGATADILFEAMRKYRKDGKASDYMEIQSGIELAKFRKRLYYLSVIVTMAPLLGLLGTISGMISAFSVFHLESGQATAITGGVGEALIATAMGLCVAIVALAVHAYFTQRIESIITDMEQCFSVLEGAADALSSCEGEVS